MIVFRNAPLRPRGLAMALGLGVTLMIAGGVHAEPKVLAKIDGVPITEDDVNDALQDIGPGLPQKLDGPARQQYALDYLIDMKLVAKKAAADKMDADAAFTRRMAYYHDKLAMEALLTDVAAKAATDEAEHKAYDEAAKAQPPVPEVHARHILLPTEEEAKAALARGQSLLDYLSEKARLAWSKTAYIDSLTQSALDFMALGAGQSLGLTSSSLPLSFVPKDRRGSFATAAKAIYPDMTKEFEHWLAGDQAHLAIAWVMGFKPRGDDARPDRGLPPLTKMLAGDEAEVLTFVYGPAPVSGWKMLAADPVKLAKSNGLWEAILAVSDGVIADNSRKPDSTPRGYLKKEWAAILKEDNPPLSVEPRVLILGEQDVDTAIHVAFESLGADIAFEGMCNPPGGDWSGISFRWSPDTPEHRWLTLPRVSAEGAKRPDHVFALFGHGNKPICLCIESKEKIGLLDANIGPRLKRYAEALFDGMPSIHRTQKGADWSIYEKEWVLQPISFVSAGAYPTSSSTAPFAGSKSGTNLDMQIAVKFANDGKSCELYLRGDTSTGKVIAKKLQSHQTWGSFVKVILVS